MSRKGTHRDIEYAVDDCSGHQRIFRTADKAAGFAVSIAMSGRENVSIDVLCHSVSGARWYGGDDAVSEYRDDPDASVFDRILIKAESIGRVR